MKNLFNETNKYKILSFLRYLGDGFFYPFFALYLSSTGLLEAKIGFILSISPLIGLLMNPIYSHFCKDIKITKRCLRSISFIEGIIIAIIPFVNEFYLLSILTLVMAIFGSCHYGLMDSLCAVYCDTKNINYSSIRVYGSSAYIIATAFGGYICEYLSYKTSFILAAVLFMISAILYELLSPIDIEFKDEKEKPRYIDLLKNKKFVFFIIFYCLIMGTTSSSDSFFSVYLESRGVTKEMYGLVYSYFVLFEVVLLIILNKIDRKLSYNKLLLVSSICLFTRMFINYLYLPVPVILALSALRGIGYAIILHVSFKYIVRIVGEKWATFGIMLCTLVQQIYVVIFNNVNGILIETYSYKVFYLIASAIAFIAIVIAVIRLYIYKDLEKIGEKNEI